MIDFTAIIAKLDTLAQMCNELYKEAEANSWNEKSTAKWKQATTAYRATKQAVELVGDYYVAGCKHDDGTYTHEIVEDT
jgi:hypothetical protein